MLFVTLGAFLMKMRVSVSTVGSSTSDVADSLMPFQRLHLLPVKLDLSLVRVTTDVL